MITTSPLSHSPHEVLPLTFIQVPDYTSFHAEFAITDGDIVFHFFRTKEVTALREAARYWNNTFPEVLEPKALEYFNVTADSKRLQAQHIFLTDPPYSEREPLDSWWLRAYGFGYLLDPHRFTLRFLEKLDQALDEATKSR